MPTPDIPCPKCGARCHLMAGVNVKPKWLEYRVLVCWPCNLAKIVRANAQWESLKATNTRPQWKKNTRHHWQTLIKGDVLDYWPTKRKWRFRDQTHVGDVEKFIRSVRDAEHGARVGMDRRIEAGDRP